ncbi:hypothetical protein WN944_018607 [Citrus x changshan-huyou]|uniref:Uncharacterized protein n=1 Tax=Citrus x changshan-huyou TaxID=2935761 RepID=A0AAP0LU00_9ROSI
MERVLFGRLDSRVIDEILLKLADNLDEFDEKISNRVYTEEKYNLKGFVFSLMVRASAGFMAWLFESISLAGRTRGPPPLILRWKTRGPPPDRQVSDLFQSQLFNDKSLMLLMPEDRDVEIARW